MSDQLLREEKTSIDMIGMIHLVVDLLCKARTGGWEIASLQRGDFAGNDRFEITISRIAPDAPTAGPAGGPTQALKVDEPSAVWRVCKAYSGDCDHCPPRETLRGEDTVRSCYLHAMEGLKAALDTPEIPSGKEA